jgi:hypothetical protein
LEELNGLPMRSNDRILFQQPVLIESARVVKDLNEIQ